MLNKYCFISPALFKQRSLHFSGEEMFGGKCPGVNVLGPNWQNVEW